MDPFGELFKKDERPQQEKKTFNKPKEKKINLFKETPDKQEMDMSKVEMVNDVAIMLYDNKPLPDDIKERFAKLFKLFNEKGINVRIMCTNSNELLPLLKNDFNEKGINLIKPWEKFCDVSGYRTWTPSNTNIRNAANYVNNFDKLPTAIKYIKSAYMTFLTSYTGKHLVKYVLIYDPFYNKKDKLDYTKSKDTFDLFRIVNNVGSMAIFNIMLDDDLKAFLELTAK